ncbi:hypothetical protein MHU86_1258 [Fragilaria crotonensis]|nr:hypothetical protein MHU86_1258 [Fragilaria crotonensis]
MSFPPSVEAWKETKVDVALYPTLLLHLGYVSHQEGDDAVILQVLCHHWSHLANQTVLDEELEIYLATQLLGQVKNKDTVESILGVVSVFAPTSVPDDLAKAILRHAEKHETAAILLHQHAKISSVGRKLYSAFCVMQNKPRDDWVDQNLYALGISLQKGVEPSDIGTCDASIFLWALSHSKKCSNQMARMGGVVDYLTRTEQSKTLASLAVHCPTITLASRLEEMVLNQKLSTKTRAEALCGLSPCSKLLQPSNALLDVIVKATLEGSETSVEVADLVCQLFDQRKVRPAVLTHLLDTNDVKIWERAMASIAKQTTSLKEHPSLLNSIAKMATRDSLCALRPQVLSLLSTLAKEKCQWVHMARNPHVVETLVKAAPNHVAMEILWDISTPISNRRILATHVGLLSSWIRFLRTLPANESRRDEWKDRLVDLANLL